MFKRFYVWHRWTALAGSLMVVVWCASGLAVHWRALPRLLTPEEQRRTLGEPFTLSQVGVDYPDVLRGIEGEPVRELRLRRAGSRLVYEIRLLSGVTRVVDASTGKPLEPVGESLAAEIAGTLAPAIPVKAVTRLERSDAYSFNLPMPLYRVTLADPDNTAVYVDATTASIAARVGRRERFYFTFGSIPHFLNFNLPMFQERDDVRRGLLFLLNTLAAAATLSGALVISWMLGRGTLFRSVGPRSSTLRVWHHFLGLIFCVPSLLFIGSGFYLIFAGSVPSEYVMPTREEAQRILWPLPQGPRILPANGMSDRRLSFMTLKNVMGVPLYTFHDVDGSSRVARADTGEPFDVDAGWLRSVAGKYLGDDAAVDTFDYLTHYDSYYYARSGRVPTLPVWRVQGRDRAKTLVYLSPDTGEIVGRADRRLRARRWLVTGFHAWDWPFLLERPLLRDAVVVLLAGGGLLLSLSGLYLGSSHLVWLIRRRRRS